jgi:very-short-patch-repair endonuclease
LSAVEINDLFDESPLEDTLCQEFKRHDIAAERQLFVPVKKNLYWLDFAIFCDRGDLNVETDGDTWHANRERIPLDNQRDNELTGAGWSVLRFSGKQIREGMTDQCIPQVKETINTLGGLSSEGLVPRKFDAQHAEAPRQLALFEPPVEYDVESW